MARRKKHPRLPNSFGSIRYIGSGRRNPYAVHPPCKETDEFGRMIRPKALCYVDDWYVGFAVLTAYHAGTYKNGDELDLRTYRQQSQGRDLDLFCQKILDNYSASRSSEFMSTRGKKTFSEVFEDFIRWKFEENHEKKLSEKAKEANMSAFKNSEKLHNRIFEQLTYDDLQGNINSLERKKASKDQLVSLYKQMYKFAIIRNLVTVNAAEYITSNAAADSERGIPFSPRELLTLWDNSEDPVVEMILILCYSGFRISAFEEMETNIEKEYFKGGVKTQSSKDRIVPFHPLISSMVKKRYQQYGDNVLGMPYRAFLYKMKKTLEEFGITGRSPHDCRHTFSRLAERFGVPEYDQKRLMGHKIDDITRSVYGHRTLEDLRKSISMIQIEDPEEEERRESEYII